jgi:SAM-dependent methyltransferase
MSGNSSDISTALESWYGRGRGQYLLDRLQQGLQPILDLTFGYHILQVGPLRSGALLAGSPINHRIIAGASLGEPVNLVAGADELPLDSDSVDAVIALHCLEFSEHPHRILRELQRVLTPQGHLILVGFNPWSLLGAQTRVRGWFGNTLWRSHAPLSSQRVQDWLHLLGCEVESVQRFYSLPPFGRGRIRRWMESGDAWCQQHRVPVGGLYAVHAIKQVAGHNRPALKPRRRERLIGLAVPKPAATPTPVPSAPARQDSGDAAA